MNKYFYSRGLRFSLLISNLPNICAFSQSQVYGGSNLGEPAQMQIHVFF